jgi:hypothetical protein
VLLLSVQNDIAKIPRGAHVIRRRVSFICAWLGLLSMAACHSATAPTNTTTTPTPTTPTTTTPTTATVTIGGTLAFTGPGQTSQLTATAQATDSSQQDVTSQATWQSSNAAAATVSGTGLLTAVGLGQSLITATYQTISGTAAATFSINLTGAWGGTGSDSTGTSNFRAVLQQSATTFGGVTGTVTFTGRAMSGSGTFSGALSVFSPQVPFVISGTASGGGATCSVTIRGYAQVSSNTFNGTYTGTNSCTGPISNGRLAMVPQ